MKNVIKRCGVVFILGPVFVILFALNMLMFFTTIVWGPIYYIITGNDPLTTEEILFTFAERFKNWYSKNFGPDE